ncbi:MAG: hypothetical protein NT010_05565 [Proteobacteria bacterium]|nr:hypothetical protein [Pseudomonadota bacterium]
MHDIINDISTWSILKWVIIVLLAGFIGQFGKSMAQAVMAKIRLTRVKKQEAKDISLPRATESEIEAPDHIKKNIYEAPVPNTGIPDKKSLKTLSKQEKKAAKLAKKGS